MMTMPDTSSVKDTLAVPKPDRMARAAPKRLDFLQPRHVGQNLSWLVCLHFGLASWFFWAPDMLPVWIYLVASVVLSMIHQRELSEWVHEASHFNLTSDKKLNDWMSDLMLGVFLLTPIHSHRTGHNRHHAMSEFFVEDDPDTAEWGVKTKREFWLAIVSDVTGVTALRAFMKRRAESDHSRSVIPNKWQLPYFVISHILVVGLLWQVGRLDIYAIYYLTLLTTYPLLNRFRLYGQHFEFGKNEGDGRLANSNTSRCVDAGIIDRLFFNSRMMMYHDLHHRYPGVPYRGLIAMQKTAGDKNVLTKSRLEVIRGVYRSLA